MSAKTFPTDPSGITVEIIDIGVSIADAHEKNTIDVLLFSKRIVLRIRKVQSSMKQENKR